MSTLPASGYIENAARTTGEQKAALEEQRDFIEERLGGGATSKLTIAAGSVTPTGGLHSIEVQAGGTDDLDTIVTTNLDAGSTLLVYADNDAEDIVLKHESGGAGQLHMIDNQDYTLDVVDKFVFFVRIGTDWYETCRGIFAATTDEAGIVERLTQAEFLIMTDVSRYVTADLIADVAQYSIIPFDAASLVPGTTDGAESGTNEYTTGDNYDADYYAFDDATQEYTFLRITEMPPTWDRGTVKFKFKWSSAAGSSTGDTVEWEVDGIAIGNNDSIDNITFGGAQVISDVLLANDGADLQLSDPTPAITIGGTPALGDEVIFRISRNVDGTDDMEEDAWLFGGSIQIKHSNAIAAW